MADLIFHPEAESEYAAAIHWYEERSPRAADRFELEVERALELICRMPESFPRYDDVHRYVLVPRFPYSVVFRTDARTVYVIAVAHSSRKPGYWQDRSQA